MSWMPRLGSSHFGLILGAGVFLILSFGRRRMSVLDVLVSDFDLAELLITSLNGLLEALVLFAKSLNL
jgi:hypothetical protein